MAWGIVYCATRDGRVPAEDFFDGCPVKVEARFSAVLEAVRDAPPPQFSGGGYWEAMHGEMGGYYEIRLTGPGRRQYRLFCVLDNGNPKQLRERGFDQRQGQEARQRISGSAASPYRRLKLHCGYAAGIADEQVAPE